MTVAIAFMACAALRAQAAYSHRHDGPLVAQPFISSAIRLGLCGGMCFVLARML